ncbi:uncharacterized protein LOC107654190 [Sinocyclocheilus anshuiensis]|uniref:uncharacterized protein LOC107654190 n=1 Tax=Sinocyclocheilus anshuiensis TaxID=1608454 RepID=UPI0007B8224A|nr:PREDICTED: uncharacterized protein LOC107654190 [Sinocyclocheilus anshuiensis]
MVALTAIIVLSVVIFIICIIFNALAGPGTGPFRNNTGAISDKYNTEITPSGWTFSIWGVIYTWLSLMHVYILTTTCRRTVYGPMYCSPAVLPYGFFITWIVNMLLNIIWLLLWDRQVMIAAFIILALIAFTNYLLIIFSCHGLKQYGAWLNKYHKVDLWCIRILVQNGIATYTTWTTIATLINFTVVLRYDAGMTQSDPVMISLSLSILLGEAISWFIVENFVFEKHLRYILTVYPVVIVALSGNMTKNFKSADPSRSGIYIAVLLGLTCTLFAIKVLLVIWRHIKHPLYKGMNVEEAISPMEIAEKQKKIFT